MWTERFVKQI